MNYLLEDGAEASSQWRNSLNLPIDRSPAEVAIQRFSLQLALDCSDTSSCTSTSSHAQPLSTSSSSSAASIAHLGSNWAKTTKSVVTANIYLKQDLERKSTIQSRRSRLTVQCIDSALVVSPFNRFFLQDFVGLLHVFYFHMPSHS